VVAFARAGKKRFLVQRAEDIAKLIEDGVVVCLPDLRGTGETASGSFVGPHSTDTTRSCRDLVLGQTMLGSRLRDLRSVLRYVRTRDDTAGPVLLWGDSLAAVNPPERQVAVPHGVDNPNVQAEPSGGLLALLGALFESDVHAVYAGGSFASFRSLLAGAFLYVPHDAVIPGALTVSDVPDIAAALAPRPVRLAGIIDGVNRRVSQEEVTATLQPVVSAFDQANASGRFSIAPSDADPAARWLLEQIGSTKASGVR
jgi:hypothetical protein